MTRAPLPLPDPALGEGAVLLRPWTAVDALQLAAAWADPEVRRWTGVPERCDLPTATRWISGERDRRERGLALDLVIDTDGAVAGEVGLAQIDSRKRTAEIGWWVRASHRRGGRATAAVTLLTQWALSELCLDALVARCHPHNPASGRVAKAAGFEHIGLVGDLELWRCC